MVLAVEVMVGQYGWGWTRYHKGGRVFSCESFMPCSREDRLGYMKHDARNMTTFSIPFFSYSLSLSSSPQAFSRPLAHSVQQRRAGACAGANAVSSICFVMFVSSHTKAL